MTSRHIYLPLIFGMVMLTSSMGVFAFPTSASGHERDTGYQVIVTQKTAETGYGADLIFTAVLNFPLADAPIDPQQLHFLINNQSYGPGIYNGQSNGQATFLLEDIQSYNKMPIGQYAVNATYFVTQSQTTIQSNTIIHTIGKGDIGGVKCLFSGTAPAPGQTITIFIQFNTNAIDPHIGTYAISFIGPTSVNYPNLTLHGASNLTMQAPDVKGNYTFRCSFNGTDLYNPVQQPDQPFVVSTGRQPGAMRLYSSPTTIVPGHNATLYVVVPTTPGLPAPTGTIGFFYDGFSTNQVTLGQGGSISVSLTLPGNDPTHPLYVSYSGDATYAPQTTSFSLTNPPITGQSSPPLPVGVLPGKGNGSATVTPTASVTATTIVGTSTIPTPTPASENAVGATTKLPPTATSSGKSGSDNLLVILVLLLLGLGGSIAGIWYFRMRRNPHMAPVTPNQTSWFTETTEPSQPPLEGDITKL